MLGLWTEFTAESRKSGGCWWGQRVAGNSMGWKLRNLVSQVETVCWLRWKYPADAMLPTSAGKSMGWCLIFFFFFFVYHNKGQGAAIRVPQKRVHPKGHGKLAKIQNISHEVIAVQLCREHQEAKWMKIIFMSRSTKANIRLNINLSPS